MTLIFLSLSLSVLFTEKSPAVNKEFHRMNRINLIFGEDHAQAAKLGNRLPVSYAAAATGLDDREKNTVNFCCSVKGCRQDV